jgi:hypothetical protein
MLLLAGSCVSRAESLAESLESVVNWLFDSLVSLDESLADEPSVREDPAVPDLSVEEELSTCFTGRVV